MSHYWRSEWPVSQHYLPGKLHLGASQSEQNLASALHSRCSLALSGESANWMLVSYLLVDFKRSQSVRLLPAPGLIGRRLGCGVLCLFFSFKTPLHSLYLI